MRNTPETDDQPTINAINDYGYAVPCVDIEYARKLERERDEARELADRYRVAYCSLKGDSVPTPFPWEDSK